MFGHTVKIKKYYIRTPYVPHRKLYSYDCSIRSAVYASTCTDEDFHLLTKIDWIGVARGKNDSFGSAFDGLGPGAHSPGIKPHGSSHVQHKRSFYIYLVPLVPPATVLT